LWKKGAKFCIHCGDKLLELPITQSPLKTLRLPLSVVDYIAQKQYALIDEVQHFDLNEPEINKWVTWFRKQTVRHANSEIDDDKYRLILEEFSRFLEDKENN
jgi:hypothetical protein